jgi:hypothetical protein
MLLELLLPRLPLGDGCPRVYELLDPRPLPLPPPELGEGTGATL